MESKLLRLPSVKERTGFRKSHLYEMIRRGEFPAPLKIGRRSVAWDSAAVEAWIRSRIDAGRRQ